MVPIHWTHQWLLFRQSLSSKEWVFLSDSTESQSREYLPSSQDIPPRLKFPASFLEGSPMIWHPEQLAIRLDALEGWDGIWQ